MSKIMRINDKTAKQIDELAQSMKSTKQAVMEKAIDAYIRAYFLQKASEAYNALAQDTVAWEEYKKELAEWDATLLDGLDKHD